MEIERFRLHTEKTRKEIERIDTAVKHTRLCLDIYRGKYLLRSDVEAFGKELDSMFQDCVAEVITLVGGNQQKAPELLNYFFQKKPCLSVCRQGG